MAINEPGAENDPSNPTTAAAVPAKAAAGQATNKSGEHPSQADFIRQKLQRAGESYMSVPPDGSILTGKQEHYLKRELISQQVKYEISELASPTALQRFGAPFRSERGEVAPEDSELPIMRYIFVHHVRNFPFLDQAKEKDFWQDKLQTFLESFANKHISGSEDRLEETKRKKLALKAEKLMELMMVSGIPTASGYEERIRFSEMEVVERGANEQGLVANAPAGHSINGWDVNIAGVRSTSVKRHIRTYDVPEYIIRVKTPSGEEHFVARTYDQFKRMHKRLRLELPGKIIPPLPRHSTSDQTLTYAEDESDAESIMSADRPESITSGESPSQSTLSLAGFRSYLPGFGGGSHRRSSSQSSNLAPKASGEIPRNQGVILYRETSRVSLRAGVRALLGQERCARSEAMREFLGNDPITLNSEELADIERRKEQDEKRLRDQRQFYEVARARAAELDVHMEKFRRDIVERNGLTKLFEEIKIKKTLEELDPEYKKFAEWVRIEVAATIYHLFLAEDNSPELFAQGKRIHSLIPYQLVKQVVKWTDPGKVMSGVLDIFMSQPFGARSLLQRIFGMAMSDGISTIQKAIDTLISQRIDDHLLADRIRQYTEADIDVKELLKNQSRDEKTDLIVCIMKSEHFEPPPDEEQIAYIEAAQLAWSSALESLDKPQRASAEVFAHLKQLLKLYMRQRDKVMMLQMIEEPNTLKLFRDLFHIFYEPLIRVYKSANVYNSIIDFARFADDTIVVIEKAQRQDFAADPNVTVQAFIDLCQRHEHNLYKFIHEVHTHDNGLFTQLMGWLEGILTFLKHGPKGGRLDMNVLLLEAMEKGNIDEKEAIREINQLIKWQMARKRWHLEKTRQKMGAEDEGVGLGLGESDATALLGGAFKTTDFGINEADLDSLNDDGDSLDSVNSDDLDEDDFGTDPLEVEKKIRAKQKERLRRTAGEPTKPQVQELDKLMPAFLDQVRRVLAE